MEENKTLYPGRMKYFIKYNLASQIRTVTVSGIFAGAIPPLISNNDNSLFLIFSIICAIIGALNSAEESRCFLKRIVSEDGYYLKVDPFNMLYRYVALFTLTFSVTIGLISNIRQFFDALSILNLQLQLVLLFASLIVLWYIIYKVFNAIAQNYMNCKTIPLGI